MWLAAVLKFAADAESHFGKYAKTALCVGELQCFSKRKMRKMRKRAEDAEASGRGANKKI